MLPARQIVFLYISGGVQGAIFGLFTGGQGSMRTNLKPVVCSRLEGWAAALLADLQALPKPYQLPPRRTFIVPVAGPPGFLAAVAG